jgi:hypothetical protein
MKTPRKYTKTEQRILHALYRLQSRGLMETGHLGTFERLSQETLASRSALLSTCQRLVKQGKLVRQKINAADRKQWGRRWPVGYARRQAHFSLSPAMMAAMEAREFEREQLDDNRVIDSRSI